MKWKNPQLPWVCSGCCFSWMVEIICINLHFFFFSCYIHMLISMRSYFHAQSDRRVMVCDAVLTVLAVAVDARKKWVRLNAFYIGLPRCKMCFWCLVTGKQEGTAVCDEMVKPSTYPTADFPCWFPSETLIRWAEQPAFWLIDVLAWLEPSATGGCCHGPHVYCLCWWEMADRIQSPGSHCWGGYLKADSPAQVEEPTSLLCDQLRWVQCEVGTPSAAPSAFPWDALEREKRELCLFISKFKLWSIWVKNAIYNWVNIWLFTEGRFVD